MRTAWIRYFGIRNMFQKLLFMKGGLMGACGNKAKRFRPSYADACATATENVVPLCYIRVKRLLEGRYKKFLCLSCLKSLATSILSNTILEHTCKCVWIEHTFQNPENVGRLPDCLWFAFATLSVCPLESAQAYWHTRNKSLWMPVSGGVPKSKSILQAMCCWLRVVKQKCNRIKKYFNS